ncbi:MAG TPA: glycosyltransferase family 4 protein [Pyrinomonadaceae bacterium]|nr:glycosyltransferase family 4 protein [Acidobacteriota bacterium]HQZ97817.1 glycosyltransferase family 4 protein [Pyrinomonadaceae bacterium]
MTKIRRKLIFFWTYLEWGGAQVYFMAIMKEALKDWDVIVILPRNSSPEMIGFLRQIGVTIEFIDFVIDLGQAPTIKRKIERQLSRISCEIKTLRFLKQYNLNNSILHIEAAPWQSWQFFVLLAMRKANVFVTMHNAINAAKWRESVWTARMQLLSRLESFHIFASNKDTKEKVRYLVTQEFWEKIPVTYTCVNPPQIRTVLDRTDDIASLRAKHGLSKNEFIVLCVGQFIDRKGRWVFLDAAKIIQTEAPDVRCVWLTPVESTKDEKAKIEKYGLNNFEIRLSSTVGSSREEVLEFFRVADIFALPSYVEGLPIALLEAMALGIPSISTNIFAIPEAVHDSETGLLIEAGDARGLAEAILKLKNDPELRQTIAKQGSEFVLSNFDEREAARIAIRHYEECFDDAD